MSKSYQRVELAANITIIFVALIIGGVLVQKYFFNSESPKKTERVEPIIGSKINLADVTWSGQPKTLILALQTTCHFCNDSAPFYRKLIDSIKDKNIRLVAVFPTGVEKSKAHLTELGLNINEVYQSPLANLQVSGTPTLILTNDKGEVTDFWVGKLPSVKEAEVIEKLKL
ncbi:MAG TPA: hypothetical protein VGC97_19440 [Pyrinomonadaceae bacterium]|jgi:thioredoxin-related protein